MARKSFVFLVVGTIVFFLCSVSSADVPHMINYQGKLTTAGGGGCLNDTVQMIFSIYPDTLGSPAVWADTQAQVVVKDGIFNVLLGSVNPIDPSVFDGSVKFLGVKVESDPEMRPLKPMVSVPYACRAGTADGGGGSGGWVDDGTVVRLETDSDSVGVGTTTPTTKLEVQGDAFISGKATIGPGHINTGSYAFVAGSANTASGDSSTVGGGSNNTASADAATVGGGAINVANAPRATVSGGAYNNATDFAAAVGGGTYNLAAVFGATVAGGVANLSGDTSATVGGGSYNKAWGKYSVVAGGGESASDSNSALGDYSTIAGGLQNIASSFADSSTIGGGVGNFANNNTTTIGGGRRNTASGTSSTVGGGSNNTVGPGYNSTVGGGSGNTASGAYSTVGGGVENVASSLWATVAGGSNDTADYQGATVGGGEQNKAGALASTVAGGRFCDALGSFSAVGGGFANEATGAASTVGGGGNNEATGDSSTVSGGGYNDASGKFATVGGGFDNDASALMTFVGGGQLNIASGMVATIGGGQSNTASNTMATVAGGQSNTASGSIATIGGGYSNTASGAQATVPGGNQNTALGDYSFAAGRRAKANHAGAFVWADDTDADFASTALGQFLVRAYGGVGLGSANVGSRLLYVANDFTTWSGQMVEFESSTDPIAANDVLAIDVPSTAPADFQFIECARGTDNEFKVNGDGNVYADGGYNTPASDFAEMIKVSSGASTVEPGDVMVIDPNNPRAILQASRPRSTLVAGIYSTKPGFIGSERDWDKPTGEEEVGTYTLKEMAAEFNEIPLAVVGIVPCKVSAENGPIRPGDLLVTSGTPGHAMRDDNPKVGTVLGKALESLSSDTGVIRVLVTLQ